MDLSYFEEVVTELVSAAVLDDDGQMVTPAVWQDVTRIRQSPQVVVYSDLLRIINRPRLNERALDIMIDLEQETAQWVWFDLHNAHLALIVDITEWNAAHPDPLEQRLYPTVPPVRPPIVTPTQWKEVNYSLLRKVSYGSWEDQMSLLYDDQVNGTTTFREGVDAVKNKFKKPGAPV